MIEAILLGNAQDAGLPQAGCRCDNCRRAWSSPQHRRLACSLGVVDTSTSEYYLIDATPDFREQLHRMGESFPDAHFAGIFITHAHIGHYTGLIHLGLEAMNVRELPVYATQRMCEFLKTHAPWRQLVELGNIALREIQPNDSLHLTDELTIEAIEVPHRAEWSDTVAFIVSGPSQRLLYLPDIDSWDEWDRSVRDVVESVDIALLDATFFSADELPGRNINKVPHPLVTDTVERLAGVSTRVHLIHLNHTNPLHRDGSERAWVESHGFAAAYVPIDESTDMETLTTSRHIL